MADDEQATEVAGLALEPDNRGAALDFAVRMFTAGRYSGGPREVVKVAAVFLDFLEGPVSLIVTPGELTYEQGSPDGPGMPTQLEGTMAQITDEQQYTASVAEVDSKGQPVTGDNLAWTIDNPQVATITPAADGYSALIAGQTDGTATYTVTDSTSNPPLTGTGTVTVVSSAATSLVITEGAAEDQPPAA